MCGGESARYKKQNKRTGDITQPHTTHQQPLTRLCYSFVSAGQHERNAREGGRGGQEMEGRCSGLMKAMKSHCAISSNDYDLPSACPQWHAAPTYLPPPARITPPLTTICTGDSRHPPPPLADITLKLLSCQSLTATARVTVTVGTYPILAATRGALRCSCHPTVYYSACCPLIKARE